MVVIVAVTTRTIARVSAPSRPLRIAAVPLMLAAGGLLSVQSEVNGRLADAIGSGSRAGVTAATISFGSGLVILALISAALPGQRRSLGKLVAAVRARRLRPVELAGGLSGAFLVASQGITVGTIGVALFSVALTAGQSASSLAVDHAGFGPAGRQRFSVPRGIAALFAVVAVLLAASERLVDDFTWQVAVFAVLPLLAGVGLAVQQALNGRVAAQVGAWTTALNNFAWGTVALVVVLAAMSLARGLPGTLPSDPWLYAGGAVGVVYIWLTALLVRVHGVLVLGLCLIAGQVVTAQLIELAGGDAHGGPLGIVATVLVVAGVGVALAVRRPAATAPVGA
jgi:transporter family-2 protein